MTRFVTRIVSVVAIAAFAASVAFATPDKGKKAAPMKCPACGMTLTTKKTKSNTKMVKMKGKAYYCCADCKMAAPKPPKKK